MKNKKWIFIAAIVIAIGVLGYNYVYQNHRDISAEEASFSIQVATLSEDFKADEGKANAKYLDKTISVSGIVTSVDREANVLVLDQVLSATFEEKIEASIQSNAPITIKGRFIGYDELLEEFKMDQVTIIK